MKICPEDGYPCDYDRECRGCPRAGENVEALELVEQALPGLRVAWNGDSGELEADVVVRRVSEGER